MPAVFHTRIDGTDGVAELAPPGHACSAYSKPNLCKECGLKDLSVCAALSADELDELNAMADHVAFEAKEILFHQGDTATSVYNVTCGTVRLYKLLSDGRRQIVGFMLPGDFIGLSLCERYGFSADAVDKTTACRFDRAAFKVSVDRKPHLLRRLHDAATHELTVAQDHMVLLGRRSADERVVVFLLSMRDRLRRLGNGSVTIPLPMTRQDLADHLGLTLETISRVVSKLARDRILLVVPDGVRILDAAKLEKMGACCNGEAGSLVQHKPAFRCRFDGGRPPHGGRRRPEPADRVRLRASAKPGPLGARSGPGPSADGGVRGRPPTNIASAFVNPPTI